MRRKYRNSKPLPLSIQYAIIGELRIMTIFNQGVDSPILIA